MPSCTQGQNEGGNSPCDVRIVCAEGGFLASGTDRDVRILLTGIVDHAHIYLAARSEDQVEWPVVMDFHSAEVLPHNVTAVLDEMVARTVCKPVEEDGVERLLSIS